MYRKSYMEHVTCPNLAPQSPLEEDYLKAIEAICKV